MTDNVIPLPEPGQRVFVTQEYAGFRAMQVCVMEEVPDAEILEVCNQVNPQLVSRGWHTVVRSSEHAKEIGVDECAAPGPCENCPGRVHKIAICL